MVRMKGLLLGAVCLLVGASAFGQSASCHQWRGVMGAYVGPWQSTSNAAAMDVVNHCNATATATSACGVTACNGSTWTCSYALNTVGGSYPSLSYTMIVSTTNVATGNPGTPQNAGGSLGAQVIACPNCAVGSSEIMTGSGAMTSAPAQVCLDGCVFKQGDVGVGISTGWAWDYKSVGSACGGSLAASGSAAGASGNCVTSASGTACVDKSSGKNCGMFNGDRVCVDTIAKGTCVSYASGGSACVSSTGTGNASTPPAPNNGTPGTTATPNMQVSQGGTTANYYNSSTVSGSSTTVVTSTPQGGDPLGDEESGEEECADESCSGTLPGANEELDSFAALTQGFMNRVGDAPLLASVSSWGASLPAGVCPAPEFELFDREMSFSVMCDIWESLAPMLSAAFLVMWGVLGARIVLSA